MKHVGTVELKTPRLVLRKFTLDDVNAMYRNWASDPEVTKYLTWPTHSVPDISRFVLESWVGETAGNGLKIMIKGDGCGR